MKMAIYNFLFSGLILLWSNVLGDDPDEKMTSCWDAVKLNKLPLRFFSGGGMLHCALLELPACIIAAKV